MKKVIMGFEFEDEEEYKIAKKETDYTINLNENLKGISSDRLLELYNKIIDEKLLKTPIGIEFLRKMQKQLFNDKSIDNAMIKSIPATMFKYEEKREAGQSAVTLNKKNNNTVKNKNLKYKDMYIKMLIINFALILAIVIMFVITKSADKFDTDYYRESIENDYISWQNELEERESAIKAKENTD